MRIQESLRSILARKNDLITTYDNSKISLDRLNQISTSMVLDDFTAIAFLPSIHWSHMITTLPKIFDELPLSIKQQAAANDLRELDILVEGKCSVKSVSELQVLLKELLSGSIYQPFWQAVLNGEDLDEVLKESFGLHELTDGTILWRRKILVNWGKALDIIPNMNTKRVTKSQNIVELALFP